ncbi:alpha/beta hydrolase [soil metagenome]
MKRLSLFFVFVLIGLGNAALADKPVTAPAEIKLLSDIAYKSGDKLSDYEKERCKLDVYLPIGKSNFATVVWFHGGGLIEGSKESTKKPGIASSLAQAGIAVINVNYRLSPKATYPAYIEDSAAAVAWTLSHIAEYGGDVKKVFIGGHSAGGYLTLMVGLDAHYLKDLGVELSSVAGLIPVSPQTMTHYTVREERGIGKYTITADEAAPVFHVRKDTPPILVLYADNDMAARAEEGAYFVAIMKGAGNQKVTGKLIADRTHGSVGNNIKNEGDAARLALLNFIASVSAER